MLIFLSIIGGAIVLVVGAGLAIWWIDRRATKDAG